MIVTEKFVFIHLHKSGGTFVNKVLHHLFSSSRQIGYHYPTNMIPCEYCHLPILGVVRNPWDFYVSYYAFQKSLLDQLEAKQAKLSTTESESLADSGVDLRNGIDVLFELLSNDGKLSFAETTANLLNLGTSGGKLDEVLELMPTELGRRGKSTPVQREGFRGMNVTRDELENIRGTGEGLYTFLFRRMYGEAEGVYFAKTDTLRQDLVTFFAHVGIELDRQAKEYILTAEPENASNRNHYSKYYTSAIENLVRERDAFVVDKFDFEFSTSTGACQSGNKKGAVTLST